VLALNENRGAIQNHEALSSKFGRFGGQFVPETLMPALAALAAAYRSLETDESYQSALADLLKN